MSAVATTAQRGAIEDGARGNRLARWAAELRWEDVDPALQAKVKAHVLDTLGVMCAGVDTPFGESVQRTVRAWGGVPESTVVGRGWRAAAAGAAMVNAFHARTHTYDDTFEEGPTHPGSAIVSAALACAEAVGASGTTFLAGVLAGYEVSCRVSAATAPAHYNAGFHTTGTCNAFGACAAANRIYELDPEAAMEALGFAGEGAAGLRQYQISGSMADTAMDGGRAAHGGIIATQLRVAGLPGARGILDGTLGFCAVECSDATPERLDRELGSHYDFWATAIKPFPSCRCTHAPTDALIGLRNAHGIDADAIEAIRIETFAHSIEVSDRPVLRTKMDAILSHQYCAALGLANGRLELADFEDERVADPRMRALAARVEVVHDPSLDAAFPKAWPHRVSVTMRDGQRYESMVEQPPGAQARPLPPELAREKFLSLAEPVLGRDRALALADAIRSAEEIVNIRELRPLLAASEAG